MSDALIRVQIAFGSSLEMSAVDQLNQWFTSITELSDAVLDAVRPKVLRNHLLHPLLRHGLRNGIGVGGQLAQCPCWRYLQLARLTVSIEGQIVLASCIRVESGRVRIIIVQLHVLVEDAIICKVFLQRNATVSYCVILCVILVNYFQILKNLKTHFTWLESKCE